MDLHKRVKSPLFTTLLLWFFLLALLPMGISNWLNYQQGQQLLIQSAQHTLVKDSNATSEYIKTWFDYRFMDLANQSKTLNNIQLVSALTKQFHESKLPLNQYIGSAAWSKLVAVQQSYLLELSQDYDYIYDVLLIDVQGNTLFSVAAENDLGTNILEGLFSKTQLAKTVALALSSGQQQFSDIEYYPPSNHLTSAFMVAPLIDKQGMTVGVIAVQLRLKRIFDRLLSRDMHSPSLTHYFVGQDSLLRSPIHDDLKAILRKKIDSLLIQQWFKHGDTQNDLQVFEYKGPEGDTVFGIYQQIQIANVKWVLLTEINKNEVFAPIKEMAMSLFVILFISVIVVLSLAIMQARRILAPINKLVDTTIKVIKGETNQRVEIKSNSEIGRLSEMFNIMLSKRLESDFALQTSNKNLRNTMLQLSSLKYALDQHAIVAITDIKGTIKFVNKKFCYISGFRSEELIGQNHRIINSGFHDLSFFKKMYKTIYSGQVWNGQICNRKKNGECYWVETTIVPFKDNQNKIQSFISIRTDITTQKEYEQKQQMELSISTIKLNIAQELALSKSLQSRLQNAFQLLSELPGYNLLKKGALFLLDENDNTLHLSVAVGDFGINKKAVISEMTTHCLTQIKQPEFIQHQNNLSLMSNDHTQPHGHCIVPILSNKITGDGIGIVGVFYLLTELNTKTSKEKQRLLEDIMNLFSAAIIREKARELLKQATIVAQQNSLLKGEFLASMSHEIRTPMNGVLGMLGLLKNSDLNHDQLHKANLAQSSAESLLVLINDILDFSKVEAGKLELDLIDFNLQHLLGDAAESLAFRAQDKGLEVILDMSSINNSMVKGDPGRIRQILTNIVSNAIKFTEQGEVKITATLLPVANNELFLTCKIEDTGIGIPQAKIAGLCDSFSQVDTSTTRQYGGTGLGLAICKKLCELMRGKLTIESELGKGSCFTFSVYLVPAQGRQNTLPKVDISQLTLLIVDDNATNREVLRGQLEQWGAEVVEAESAEQALQLCEQRISLNMKLYDVAFLDMQMPEMDGAQLGTAIRNNPLFNEMRMVMMTSIANQNEIDFFAELDFDAYFPKPATPQDLFDALNVVVDNGQARKNALPLVTRDYLQTLVSQSDVVNNVTINEKPSEQIMEQSAFDKSKAKLLLVEDNVINQLVALAILAEHGFTAETAKNGQIALDLLNSSEHVFDLIFMDCQMPVLDGYKTTQAIRAGKAGKQHITIPIIAMTANAIQGDEDKCLSAGMDDYISKPINPNLLESILCKWLLGHTSISTVKELLVLPSTIDSEQNEVIWDQAGALSRLLKKEDLLVDLLLIFKREIPTNIAQLKAEIKIEKHESIRALAHTIKGAASNVSALKLAFYASELEQAAIQKQSQKYLDLFFQLDKSYNDTALEFTIYIDNYGTNKDPNRVSKQINEEQLKAQLILLLARLKSSDFIDNKEIENLINTCDKPKLTPLLKQLYEQVSLFDLMSAMITTEKLLVDLSESLDEKSEN